MKRAICLSGGGAKGAYQIGVLKALKKLKINYDIVTGTSVGALNGILYVQKDLYKALRIWKKMHFNQVFDETVIEKYNNLETEKDIIKMYTDNYINNDGMEIKNLENLAKKILNPRKFFDSKIDYLMCTYNLTKRKPVRIKKEDLNKENIYDYILASSSCYPIIKKRIINNDEYIDGGIFDNLPINSAIDMGANEIIAVDLKAPGLKRLIKNKKVKIITIKPQNNIGSFLNFNKHDSKRAIKFGYYDTLKIYNRLDGDYYTFKKNQLNKNNIKYTSKIISNLELILKDNNKLIKNITIKRFIRIGKDNHILNEIIEYTGKTFNIEDCKCYRINKFNKLLLKKLHEIKVDKNINDFNILNIFNRQKAIKEIYYLIKNNNINELNKLAITLPKEFLSALYLYSIEKR